MERRLGESCDRIVEREVVAAAQHLQQGEKRIVAILTQWLDRPLAQRKALVGDDLGNVEHSLLAQPVAMGASSLGRVERKGVRRRIFERHARRGAHQMPRIEPLLVGAVIVEGHRALALPHGLLERGHEPLARLLAHRQAIDDQIDRVYLIAVEAHAGRNFANLPVDAGIDIPFLGQGLEQLAVMTFAPLDDRRQEGDFAPCEVFEDQFGDLLIGVMHHFFAGNGRIGTRRPGIEQTQKVVDLGHGAHRGAGILVGGLLLDGHDGA